MAKEIEGLNLDERFTGSHFYENGECGSVGKIVAELIQRNQAEESHKNIHVQLLRVLRDTSLESLLELLGENSHGKENRKDALAYRLRKKSAGDKDCYYYNRKVPYCGREEDYKISVSLPTQRMIARGHEGVDSCCELVEKLLSEIVIDDLERLIIHGIGEPTTQPLGLLMQIKDKNEEGEAAPEAINRFHKANEKNSGALVMAEESWKRLKQKAEAGKLTKDREGTGILYDALKVWISNEMPANVGAIINTKKVYLAVRDSPDLNNWWNYKESIDSEVCWKYRYACNLVVEDPKAAIKFDINGLK